jgi:hypothetical protein
MIHCIKKTVTAPEEKHSIPKCWVETTFLLVLKNSLNKGFGAVNPKK